MQMSTPTRGCQSVASSPRPADRLVPSQPPGLRVVQEAGEGHVMEYASAQKQPILPGLMFITDDICGQRRPMKLWSLLMFR